MPINDKRTDTSAFIKSGTEQLFQGGKLGVQSIGKLAGVFVLFAVTNLVLLGVLYYQTGVSGGILGGLLGCLFTAYAVHRTYCVVLISAAKFVYVRSSPLFHKICMRIIEHASELDVNEKKREQVIDFSYMMSEQFGNRCPLLIRSGISLLLSRIPMTGMLSDMEQIIASGNREQAGIMLFEKVDHYVHKSIFETNTMKYFFWLLPTNVLLLLGIGMVL